MIPDRARVLLVLPTAQTSYFASEKYSNEWHVRQALRVADKVGAGAGIDVLLYGNPASGGYVEDGIVVRTRVEAERLESWTAEWSVITDTGLDFLQDARPTTRVEETFAVGGPTWFSHSRAALREVVAALKETPPGRTLVIFQMDGRAEQREIVLAIRDAGEGAAFWQLFGKEHAIGYPFWTQDGLHRGRVLANLAVHIDTDWSRRAVVRRFSRWRKRAGS